MQKFLTASALGWVAGRLNSATATATATTVASLVQIDAGMLPDIGTVDEGLKMLGAVVDFAAAFKIVTTAGKFIIVKAQLIASRMLGKKPAKNNDKDRPMT
jgi:hypothetical protein